MAVTSAFGLRRVTKGKTGYAEFKYITGFVS